MLDTTKLSINLKHVAIFASNKYTMKILTSVLIALFLSCLDLNSQISPYGFKVAPIYMVSEFKDSFIKTNYTSSGVFFSFVAEKEFSKYTSLLVEPGVSSTNFEYEGFNRQKSASVRVTDNLIGLELPLVFRIYMGDKVRFISDFGLGLRIPIFFSQEFERSKILKEEEITSKKDYSSISLGGTLGFGISSYLGENTSYSVVLRKSFNNSQLRSGFTAGVYSLNFIFVYRPSKNAKKGLDTN